AGEPGRVGVNRQDATSPAADGPEARAGTPATTDRPTALRGVHTIMPTPFTPDGRLDEESLARLTRFLVARGVDGVTVLGFLGEAHKLSEAEQDVVVTVTVQAAGGRVPVFAGASAGGVKVGVERGLRFVELGAAGLMVAPVAPEAATVLARIHEDVASVTSVRLEDPPTTVKLRAFKRLAPGMSVLGGLGGLYLAEEMAAGANGVMTGVSFPELLLGVVRGAADPDPARRRDAADAYRRAAALLAFEFQPVVGLALRKKGYSS